MAIQFAELSLININDAKGIDSVMVALKNITGVTTIDYDHTTNIAVVSYEDTKTSIHAFTAAISMVDYVTQAYPIDAPQNPRYHE